MASTYKIIYTEEALGDIDEIIGYILSVTWRWSADKWARKFFEKIESLALFPEGNPIYEFDGTCRTTRAGKYSIIYEVNKDRLIVIILRVIYAKRDFKKIKIRNP
ncbi:type II toxin-antitoxin system RelE/ParE family toxin [Candidatus Saccharibacteria bacterium]|nr:type II toxin-antitoxin system RelE/ParE family toxin [Candidatus Saccharibacteria bacterium]